MPIRSISSASRPSETPAGVPEPLSETLPVRGGGGLGDRHSVCSRGHVDPPRFPTSGNCKLCMYDRNKQVRGEQGQRKRARVRREVLTHYGGADPVCADCGCDDYDQLQLDHVDGKGREHRNSIKPGKPERAAGYWTYREVIKAGFPEGYRVLCNPCNQKRRWEMVRAQESV